MAIVFSFAIIGVALYASLVLTSAPPQMVRPNQPSIDITSFLALSIAALHK